MEHEEEILKTLQEIRDELAKHHTRWEEAIRNSEEQQKKINLNVAKARRRSLFITGLLILLIISMFFVHEILSIKQFSHNLPFKDYFNNTVDTAGFDGEYVLDTKRSFANLFSNLPRETDEEKREFQQVLAEQYDNFQINKGVITSGKTLVQEFRITSANISDGVLEGKAIWHEDIYDPGDCYMMKVRLKLKGDELEFSYCAENEEPSEKIFLRKKKN
jgi:hypothetical protein